MAAIVWDAAGKKFYSTGTKNGVLYTGGRTTSSTKTKYNAGVAWNGLTGVTETPGGAEANDNFADDIKYISLRGAETFNFTIEAFMAPDEWAKCDGQQRVAGIASFGQQERAPFGMMFISTKGNDKDKNLNGFEIHLEYNATASPSERAYTTINENPELLTFSWECTSDPVEAGSGVNKPVSNIIITCTIDNEVLVPDATTGWKWAAEGDGAQSASDAAKNAYLLYQILTGTVSTAPTLPEPGTVYTILTEGGDIQTYAETA